VVCEATVIRLGLLVQDEVDQVEPGEECGWKLDVLDDGKFGVILRVDRIRGSQNRSSSVQGANDASFGDGDSLLLHGLVKDHTSVVVHLVELIDAADATVR